MSQATKSGGDDVERIEAALPSVVDMAEADGAELSKTGTEYRCDHPHHDTPTSHPRAGNLCISESGDTWHCKRHDHGAGKLAWVAMSEGIVGCGGLESGRIPRSLFRDVLEVAADRAGVELDDAPDRSDENQARRDANDLVRQEVAGFYHRCLDEYDMRDELKRRYGLSDDVIDENSIGYAPPAGMDHDLPGETGRKPSTLKRIGVLRESGAPHFQHRFVFPYFEPEKGDRRVRYFTARAVDGDGPKYLKLAKNDHVDESAQREPPFGIGTVRGAREVIVTEGVTDALVLHDHGFAAVSPVTTHISGEAIESFAKKLRGKEVYVVYDHDAGTQAGIQGAARDAWALKQEGVDARVARLPARPNESIDVAEFFLDHSDDEPAARFRDDVLESVTFPAGVAYWAWDSGGRHRLFEAAIEELGYDPAFAQKRTNEDGDTYWLSVEDLVEPADSLAEARRRFYADGKSEWSGGTHKEAYHWIIRWTFETRGEFFKTDTGEVHYYYEPENRVVRVTNMAKPGSPDDEFSALITSVFGITTGEWGRSLYQTVTRAVAFDAKDRPSAKLSYYDSDRGELYVNSFDGHYYALDGESVERRRNGSDVFFLSVDDAEPWTYIDPEKRANLPNRVPGERHPFVGQGDLVHRLIANRVNFDEHANLGPLLQRSQLYIHLHAIAFGSEFTGRPIMAWVGQKGSGKTVVLRSIGRFFYGSEWSESTMQEKQDDFIAKIAGKTLAAIDNYDDGVEWANDMLASVATGTSVEKRELYTTNDLTQIRPRCFLAITSRDPPFRRDDVADRCLVFRLSRVDGEFIGETAYLKQVTLYRDDLWSEYVDNLNDILAVRQSNDDPYRETTHRMADWAMFARDAADALDVEGVDELLDSMKTERAFFALEDEPLRLVIEAWLKENPDGGSFEAGELLREFQNAAEKEGIQMHYSSARGLSRGLTSLSDELGELFGMEVVTSRSGANRYKFPGGGTQYMLGYGPFDDGGEAS